MRDFSSEVEKNKSFEARIFFSRSHVTTSTSSFLEISDFTWLGIVIEVWAEVFRRDYSLTGTTDRRKKKKDSSLSEFLLRPGPSDSGKTNDNWMSQKRIDRHFRINGGKTKLTIKQGDITRTKVDAIVNGKDRRWRSDFLEFARFSGQWTHDGRSGSGWNHSSSRWRSTSRRMLSSSTGRTGRSTSNRSFPNFTQLQFIIEYEYIINTAGPVYDSYEKERCAEELESCYKTALALANLYDLTSIAFQRSVVAFSVMWVMNTPPSLLHLSTHNASIMFSPLIRRRSSSENVRSTRQSIERSDVILFDDHIYDAWIKKVTELNYPASNRPSPWWNPKNQKLIKRTTMTRTSFQLNRPVRRALPRRAVVFIVTLPTCPVILSAR